MLLPSFLEASLRRLYTGIAHLSPIQTAAGVTWRSDRLRQETQMSALAIASARSAVSLAQALDDAERPYRRERRAGEGLAVLSLKVESRYILNVRRALVQSGAPSVRFLDCRRVPHSTCSRVRVCCDHRWTGVIMRNIMQTVSAAEFGRCETLRA
jgi:hypothetical protein